MCVTKHLYCNSVRAWATPHWCQLKDYAFVWNVFDSANCQNHGKHCRRGRHWRKRFLELSRLFQRLVVSVFLSESLKARKTLKTLKKEVFGVYMFPCSTNFWFCTRSTLPQTWKFVLRRGMLFVRITEGTEGAEDVEVRGIWYVCTLVAPRNQRQMLLWHLAGLAISRINIYYTPFASPRL